MDTSNPSTESGVEAMLSSVEGEEYDENFVDNDIDHNNLLSLREERHDLERLCRLTSFQYTALIDPKLPEKISELESLLEEVLLRHEEAVVQAEIIESYSDDLVQLVLPQLIEATSMMRPIYDQIDRLEVLVQRVWRNIGAVDKRLTELEEETSPMQPFKKSLTKVSQQLFSAFRKKPEPTSGAEIPAKDVRQRSSTRSPIPVLDMAGYFSSGSTQSTDQEELGWSASNLHEDSQNIT